MAKSHQSASGTSCPEDDAVLDRLIEQVSQRCRLGEGGDLNALVAEHPQYGSILRQMAPVIAALENRPPSDSEPRPELGAPTPAPAGPVDQQIGEFLVVREIGRGGMGIVYEAVQAVTGPASGAKVFPMAGLLDDRQLQRFQTRLGRPPACIIRTSCRYFLNGTGTPSFA
jgi:eukaryotic-like serine/threonine-protein kinase